MYCVPVSTDLLFCPIPINLGDDLIIDENMPMMDGDLILLQWDNKKMVTSYFDCMTIKEGVTAHVVYSVNKNVKDDEATRHARLKRVGAL